MELPSQELRTWISILVGTHKMTDSTCRVQYLPVLHGLLSTLLASSVFFLELAFYCFLLVKCSLCIVLYFASTSTILRISLENVTFLLNLSLIHSPPHFLSFYRHTSASILVPLNYNSTFYFIPL